MDALIESELQGIVTEDSGLVDNDQSNGKATRVINLVYGRVESVELVET